MKKLNLVMVIFLFFIVSCEKDDDKSFCDAVNSSNGGNGIGQRTTKQIMFYITKDLGCGYLEVTKIRNKKTEDTNFTGTKTISSFYSGEPACGASGTATIEVTKGYTYEYALVCENNRTFTGEFTADCENTCLAIEIK